MKECDNSKIHISSNFILPISLLIMIDTLLLRPSLHCNTPLQLHHTSPNYTLLHFTTLHHTSPNYTSPHFTLHPTTLHHTSPNYTSPNYTSPHFTTLITRLTNSVEHSSYLETSKNATGQEITII